MTDQKDWRTDPRFAEAARKDAGQQGQQQQRKLDLPADWMQRQSEPDYWRSVLGDQPEYQWYYGGQQQTTAPGYEPRADDPMRRMYARQYDLNPKDYEPSFWEDPYRVARYKHYADSLQPGEQLPTWLDKTSLDLAYDRMAAYNKDAPYYAWRYLPADDPYRDLLKSMQEPPPEGRLPGDQVIQVEQLPLPEEPTLKPGGKIDLGGLTEDEFAALPGWQQNMIKIFGQPWLQGAAIGLQGGLPGALVGAGIGQGAARAASEGGALGEAATKIMGALDIFAEGFERALGTPIIAAGAALTGKYSFGDIITHLDDVWNAAHLTYELTPVTWHGWDVSALPSITSTKYEQLGQEEIGLDALLRAYQRIRDGEKPETVWQDMSARVGFQGQMREMFGHVFADPLNFVDVMGKGALAGVGKLTGNVDLVQAAMKSEGGLIKGLELYRTLERVGKTEEELSRLGTFHKWLLGVDQAGKDLLLAKKTLPDSLRAMETASKVGGVMVTSPVMGLIGYGIGGPTGAVVGALGGGYLGWKSGLGYLTGLTPSAKASELTNVGAINLQNILSVVDDDVPTMLHTVRSLANTPADLARELSMVSIRSPEGAVLPMALRDFDVDAFHNLSGWDNTTPIRTILQNISDATGKPVYEVLHDLGREGADASALLRQFVDTARQSTDTAAQEIVRAYDAGELMAAVLQDIGKVFTRDKLPYNEQMYKAQLYSALTEHTARWTAKYFDVKPDPTWVRLSNTIKSAQSIALLGGNPIYLANNAINNLVTMAYTGVFGLRSMGDIGKFWDDVGIIPPRLRAGFGPAAIGEDIPLEIAFGKEVLTPGQQIRAGETAARLELRKAATAPGKLTDIDRWLRGVSDKFGVFSNLSAKVEQWSSAQAMTAGYKQMWARLWGRGRGYDPMPPALEQALGGIDPNLPGLIYGVIDGAKNRAEIESKLWSGVVRHSVDSFVPEVARNHGMDEGALREILQQSGAYDFLRNALGDNPTPQQVSDAFRQLREQVNQRINDNVRDGLVEAAEAARVQVANEGWQAALDIYDRMELSRATRWLQNFADWERVFTETETMTPGARGVIIRQQANIEQAEWQRQWAHEKASYLGVAEALGIDNPESRSFIELYGRVSDVWDGYHTQRWQKLRDFFNTVFDTPERRSAVWNDLQDELDRMYVDAAGQETALQTQMDGSFVRMFETQFGEGTGRGAAEWRLGVRNIRDQMVQEMRAHRDSVRNLPREEKLPAWTQFLDETYKPLIVQRFRENVEGVRRVFGNAGAVEGEYEVIPPRGLPPGEVPPPIEPTPPPVEPTQPPIITPPPTEPIPPVEPTPAPVTPPPAPRTPAAPRAATPQADTWMDEAQRVLDQANRQNRLNDARQVAQRYGIPTADETGRLIPGSDRHIQNVINRYGSPEVRGKDLRDIDAADIEAAFQARAAEHTAPVVPAQVMPARMTQAVGVDGNTTYDFEFRVVDLDTLTPSHTDTLEANPIFPQELQPRLRERAASEMQVDRIARELNPDALLLDTHRLDSGPMIVGPDGIVESGNGRVLALRRARDLYPDRYNEYAQSLLGRLQEYGLSEEDLQGVVNPVLVRVRMSDVDRPAFVVEANQSIGLRFSPFEQALQDAGLVRDNVLGQLEVGETQSLDQAINSTANRALVRSFLDGLPETERAALLDQSGHLNAQGVERLKMALFAKTYPGDSGQRLLQIFSESIDPGIKNVENAMFASLGRMAQAEGMIRAGTRAGELSIADDLVRALDVYERLKQGRLSVPNYLAQATMFERELNPFQEALLKYLSENSRSPKRLRELMIGYAQEVINQAPSNQIDMFGGVRATKGELLENVARRLTPDELPLFRAAEEATATPPISQELERPVTGGGGGGETGVGGTPEQIAEVLQREYNAAHLDDWRRGLEEPVKAGDRVTGENSGRIALGDIVTWNGQEYVVTRRSGYQLTVDRMTPEGPKVEGGGAINLENNEVTFTGRNFYKGDLSVPEQRPFPVKMTRETFREQLRQSWEGATDEQVDAFMTILDAEANYWSKQTGKPVSDYYGENFAGVVKGGVGELEQAAPIWYSKLERVIEGIQGKELTVERLRSMLEKGQVKGDEIRWTGLEDWLKERAGQKVSKDEVLDFVRGNRVEVKEVIKGESHVNVNPLTWQKRGESWYSLSSFWQQNRQYVRRHSYKISLDQRIGEYALYFSDDFDGYFPSFEAARDRAWKIEQREAKNHIRRTTTTKYEQYVLPGAKKYRELLFTLPGGEKYISPHWSEQNVLAHVRFDDRVDDQGRRILFVEEVQSDWHQKGREIGYGYNLPEGWSVEEFEPLSPLTGLPEKRWQVLNENGSQMMSGATREETITKALDIWGVPAVPPAPFAETWQQLVMKRMLRWASENGYDGIAWTTGVQQSDRYAKALRENYPNGLMWTGKDLYSARADGRNIDMHIRYVDTEEGLAKIVGKDIAKKLVSASPDEWGIRYVPASEYSVSLKGMQEFYDRNLVNWLDKYTKQWGGKVGETRIATGPTVPGTADMIGDNWQFQRATENVHYMDITPAMRESVMQGQPLFQGAKAAVSFSADGRAVLRALNGADISSLVHEAGHVFRRHLSTDDVKIAEDWAGVSDGVWLKEHEEKFAKGFEEYLREGKAPTEGLRGVFEKFKGWLTEIYARLRGHPLIELNDDMRALFDKMLGDDPEAQRFTESTNPWFETDTGPARLVDDRRYQTGDGEIKTLFQEDGVSREEPIPAVNAPLGTAEHGNNIPPINQASEEFWRETVWPLLSDLRDRLSSPRAQEAADLGGVTLTPEMRREVRAWLGKVSGQMADAKLAGVRWAENRRDMALLNYSRRYGWDNFLGAIFPYQFWYTRSMMNWASRALDKPGLLANYARIRNLQNMVRTPGYPSRLAGKTGIPMPYMPEWAGDELYVDPLRQLFPIHQLLQPFETVMKQTSQVDKRAEYAIQEWLGNGDITNAQAMQALQTRSGPLWEKALAQSKNELDADYSNPFDFMSLLTGPSLPIQWATQLLRGKPENISQLPITRFIQSISSIAGLNNGKGVNIEGPIRRALGWPERGQYQDYFVDRMLANMAADGTITPADATKAMVERSGPAFELAQQRVSKIDAARYFAGSFSADFFPEGEKKQRENYEIFKQAIEARDAGDPTALTRFFDEHPEFDARLMQGDDPDSKLRQYLISEVWDRYQKLPDLERRTLTNQFGDVFQNAFLNKETRSYDAIDTATLAWWTKTMGGYLPKGTEVPQVPVNAPAKTEVEAYQKYVNERNKKFPDIGKIQDAYYKTPEANRQAFLQRYPQLSDYWNWRDQFMAENPSVIPNTIGEDNALRGAPPQVQQAVYEYRSQRTQMFPDIFTTQDKYYSLTGTAKKNYLKQHPELSEYWNWQRSFLGRNPEAIPYIKSTEQIASAVLGEDYTDYQVDPAQFDPVLIRQLMGYFYGNQPLSSGARQMLRRVWEKNGKPMGSLDAYINKVLKWNFSQ